MKLTSKTMVHIFVIGLLILLYQPPVARGDCPGGLDDRNDVVSNPPGNNYDVYYTDNGTQPACADCTTQVRSGWVRDALLNSHNVYVSSTHNFNNPYFNDTPNDTCIFDIATANVAGSAPESRINIDAPYISNNGQNRTRTTTLHELFHHVQFSYIDFNQWPSWGKWTIEGTAAMMEDKTFLDLDDLANIGYLGRVNAFLGDTNTTLMDHAYTAALFWTYLCEQLGTRSLPEPALGVDLVQRFWANTAGESPDAVKYLRETINSFSTGRTFESIFRDFAIANYTHDLDVSLLATPNRYLYLDESDPATAGRAQTYGAVNLEAVPGWNITDSSSVNRWAARYFEIGVPSEKRCEAVGFWGQAKNGKKLSWALIGMRGGQVIDIYPSAGNTFTKALINPPGRLYDTLAAVVVGLNQSDDFDYAFGWGAISGQIRRPDLDHMAFVGNKTDPERFQVRMLLTGPAALTPPGSGPTSIKGLDVTDFGITLRSAGTGAVYDADIVNASYVSGEYWLVVQAPEITNPADGDLYDLEICFCEDGGTCKSLMQSAKSVLYAKITTNQMLVLDRSYSMHYPESDPKLEAAKNAASLYVSAAADDDRLGFVTFSGNDSECDVDLDGGVYIENLAPVSGSRTTVQNTIASVRDNVPFRGWTSIGDGLKEGRDQLLTVSGPAERHSIALLSDGRENEGDYWDRSNGACSTPPVKDSFTSWADEIRVDTIAFGDDADQNKLQNIAVTTDGDYYWVSTDSASTASASALSLPEGAALEASVPSSGSLEVPNRLAQVYRSIEETVHGQDRLFYSAVRVAAGGGLRVDIPVEEKEGGGVRDPVFAFNWNTPGSGVTIRLLDPSGHEVAGGGSWKIYTDRNTNKTYHYNGILDTGTWTAVINSGKDIQALCMLSGKLVRGVDIGMYLSKAPYEEKCKVNVSADYKRGLPVGIMVNLNDGKGGVEDLTVEAVVDNPDGSVNRLTLFDDGDHGDGLAGDGIYGNDYTRTPFFSNGGVPDFPAGPPSGSSGSYTVTVSARGINNFREEFQRFISRGFQVFEYVNQDCEPDRDRDGLPDRWEDLVGLNSSYAGDAGLDNDNDDLTNEKEFFYGTHPFNPDSDGGGESDGSEVNGRRDPLYEKDDLLPPVIDYGVVKEIIDIPVHLPRPNTNILHYPVNPTYRYMQIWRTDPGWIGFRMVQRLELKGEKTPGVYYDERLTNGVAYGYYLVAEGLSSAETAPTEVFTGIPLADPLSPIGWVTINGLASRTDSLNVNVQLYASDDTKWFRIARTANLSGSSWQAMNPEIPYTLALGGPEPSPAWVYVKYRDAAGNESIVYGASIIVDRFGDFDGDRILNYLDNDDDGDGLQDQDEITVTNLLAEFYDPFNKDTDGNGVDDGNEDPDRDTLTNRQEIKSGTDPAMHLSDMDQNGEVNQTDESLFKLYYSTKNPRADVNGDGRVDRSDLTLFEKALLNELSHRDTDGDRLSDAVEYQSCTAFNDADTDDDGLSDGVEDSNLDGNLDSGETDPCETDSDSDGLQDGTESGVAVAGSGTDTGVFKPDLDPATTTNPLDPDTDDDKRLDGAEDANGNGRVDPGETDPNTYDPGALPHLLPLLLDGRS